MDAPEPLNQKILIIIMVDMKKSVSADMTSGNLRTQIITFAFPIFLGNLFQLFYNTADSFIVGNYIGPEALAAVSSTGALISILVGFFQGFSVGAGIVTARNIGKHEEESIQKSVHTSAAMGLVLTLLISVLGVLISEPILKLMNTPGDILPEAAAYLRIYFAGSAGLIMYNMFVGTLQAAGDSRNPLYYLIISSLLNIVLDIVFIRNFHLGVAGAAYATVLTQAISALLAMANLMHRKDSIHLRLRSIGFDRVILKQMIRLGLPTAAQGCIIDFSNMLIQSYINSFGSAAVAGIGVSARVESLTFLPTTAFSMAVSTFVSQNIGAGKKDRAYQGIRFCLLLCMVMTEVLSILIYAEAGQLISLFTEDPEVIAFGTERARTVCLFSFLAAFTNVSSEAVLGLGKAMTPMAIVSICWCAVRVAVLFTIGQVFHFIELVFWIYPITWTLSSIVYLLVYRKLQVPLYERQK